MIAGNNIARTILTWIAAVIGVFFIVALPAMAAPVHVKVQDGDTSFLVDVEAQDIWWITETCRYEVPVKRNDDTESDAPKTSISSERFIKDVQIGSHRFKLEQEFRFDGVTQTPTLQVFNSARGGWSEIDIDVDSTCINSSCRARLELPLCVD